MIACQFDGCNGWAVHAKLCRTHLNEQLARRKVVEHPVPEGVREAAKLAQYGIAPADYRGMLEQQGGVCAICRRPEQTPGRSLAVDHDHATGAVRGLLCGRCNRGIGFLCDNPELLEAAAGYIRAH